MSRKQHTPTFRFHKATGQAVVTLTDANGKRHDVYLGKYDDTPNSPSRQRYLQVLAEWEANGRRQNRPTACTSDITISEIADAFKPYVDTHYRYKDGSPTPEVELFRLSLLPLRRLYGTSMAKDFGPLALKAVRTAMITGNWMTQEEKDKYTKAGKPIGLCRGTVNKRIGRIRRMFRWAVEEEMIPATTLHALEAVKGLEAGRSPARETEPVKPVPEAHVSAVLPFLRPQLADMIQLQMHTGMRSGEICSMRSIDIDTTGKVWLYNPAHHKTAHRGLSRIIPLGPKAQEIVKRNLKTDLYSYLFSPRDAVAEFRDQRRQSRKTKVYPCEQRRMAAKKRTNPKRLPRERYTPEYYAQAVARACIKAGVPHFHPHQIRHTKATEIRRTAGLDAARAVLGHHSPAITELYAELDMAKASEVMAQLG